MRRADWTKECFSQAAGRPLPLVLESPRLEETPMSSQQHGLPFCPSPAAAPPPFPCGPSSSPYPLSVFTFSEFLSWSHFPPQKLAVHRRGSGC